MSMITMLSSCGVVSKKSTLFIDDQNTASDCEIAHSGQVCFMNYATKLIEIQFEGEKESYSIYPQKNTIHYTLARYTLLHRKNR